MSSKTSGTSSYPTSSFGGKIFFSLEPRALSGSASDEHSRRSELSTFQRCSLLCRTCGNGNSCFAPSDQQYSDGRSRWNLTPPDCPCRECRRFASGQRPGSVRDDHRVNAVNSNRYDRSTWIRADNGDDSEHSSKRRTNFHSSRRWGEHKLSSPSTSEQIQAQVEAELAESPTGVLQILRGQGQIIGQGYVTNQPFTVVAKDAAGNPIKNVPITWSVAQGSGTLVTVTNVTDEQGLATATYINPLVLPGTPFATAWWPPPPDQRRSTSMSRLSPISRTGLAARQPSF